VGSGGMACLANVEQCRGGSIFLGVEKVGAFLTEAITDFASLAFPFTGRWRLGCRHGLVNVGSLVVVVVDEDEDEG